MIEERHYNHLYVAMAELAKPREGTKGGLLFVEADAETDALSLAISMFTLLDKSIPAENQINLGTVKVRRASGMEMFLAASTGSFINQERYEALRAGDPNAEVVLRTPDGQQTPIALKPEPDDGVLDAELLM